jgi:transcriptional regulator with XRE-family HTH domain
MTADQPPTVADVLAKKVRQYREAQGLRQEDLAERITKLGYPMNRVTLAKIEAGGTRTGNASLTEVLMLAAALDVPPPLLFLPLGDVELMTMGTERVHPHLVLDWLAGDLAFTMSNRMARDQQAWYRNAQPLFMFRRLRELQNAASRVWPTVDLAEGVEVPDRRWELVDEALTRLAEHLEYMRQAGLSVPEMPDGWRERMATLGVDHGQH